MEKKGGDLAHISCFHIIVLILISNLQHNEMRTSALSLVCWLLEAQTALLVRAGILHSIPAWHVAYLVAHLVPLYDTINVHQIPHSSLPLYSRRGES